MLTILQPGALWWSVGLHPVLGFGELQSLFGVYRPCVERPSLDPRPGRSFGPLWMHVDALSTALMVLVFGPGRPALPHGL